MRAAAGMHLSGEAMQGGLNESTHARALALQARSHLIIFDVAVV